jgi:hypothetical protein
MQIFETDTNKVMINSSATSTPSWVEVNDLDSTGGLATNVYNSLRRYGYTERTTSYVAASTTFNDAANIFATSITFTALAATTYIVECFVPYVQPSAAANARIFVQLANGTTNLGVIGMSGGTGSGRGEGTFLGRYFYTPGAVSVTLNARASNGGQGGTDNYVNFGTGANASSLPGYLAVYGPDIT